MKRRQSSDEGNVGVRRDNKRSSTMREDFIPLGVLARFRVVCIHTQKNNIPIIRLQTLVETATLKRYNGLSLFLHQMQAVDFRKCQILVCIQSF